MLTSPGHQLAAVRFCEPQDFGDLPVGVVEFFAENIGCSFRGREFLEQQRDGELQRLAALGSQVRIGAGIRRLGKPGSDAGFMA